MQLKYMLVAHANVIVSRVYLLNVSALVQCSTVDHWLMV